MGLSTVLSPDNTQKTPIAVLGAGSWGTALAIQLARNGNDTRLWGHAPSQVEKLKNTRSNERYLPGIVFPDGLTVYDCLADALQGVSDIMLVVPSQCFSDVLLSIQESVQDQALRIAWGTKGVDRRTSSLLHQVVLKYFPSSPVAVLSGPSFAIDVALGRPTAVSLASNNAVFLNDLVSRFHSSSFRVYSNHDLVGVQLCGVMKNVLAIAVGMSDGMGLGASCRAALITRGAAEMRRLLVALGGDANTLQSLAGMGDLILTCTDDQSRNRRLGLALGAGKTLAEATASIGQEIEGMHNASQIVALGAELDCDLPIATQVMWVLTQQITPAKAVEQLLERVQRSESGDEQK